ncbi:MAG TPA: gluconokinase [Chthoniobacteraceae bacterium]|jgi:gluconokinase
MSSLILALDLGTSSTRTALFDERAERIPGTTAQQSYPLLTTADGGAELEPHVVLHAVRQCLEETMRAYRSELALKGRRIGGVGVSCFWHSLLGTDEAGEPLTNIITWAESRCRPDAAQLREELSEKAVHGRTGCMLRASFWPAKLKWLQRTQARLFRQVRRWMSPAEWLQLMLCEDANCALGMATGTGLFDPTRLGWDRRLLVHCGLEPGQLQPLSDAPTTIGGRLAAQFPELKGVPWFPGIGDGAASNLGSGATRPGLAAINVGTSAALRIMREGPTARAPFGLFCYRVDAQRYLVGGAVSNAGNLRAWCVEHLQLPAGEGLEDQLASRPGPDHRLVVLPFWNAERAPTWDEEATGAIHGITQHTSSLDLLQAITEGSYHRLARIAELLIAAEPSAPKFIVSGGIQKSASAMQRLADVLGLTIYANDEMEASIRGAAIYALEKLGVPVPKYAVAIPVRPRPKLAQRYAEERVKQIALERLMLRARRP